MRTRFAPSPTGYLHIGGLRTALFSYLLAKKNGGVFFLRIEDTDRERHVEDATKHLVQMLTWAGIPPEEGVLLESDHIVQKGKLGPYIQSKRLPLYQEHVRTLINAGHAYRCFCTKERLDEMRKSQEERHLPPMYDRECATIPKEESGERAKKEPHVVRMRVPRGEKIEFRDLIRGKVEFASNTLDDQVLLKSDGFPTYHLAHVVDDHLMETTHVIRGEEWLPSLPKHLLLFRMFGWAAPEYAHVPLLMNPGGGKLSKRPSSAPTFAKATSGKEASTFAKASVDKSAGKQGDVSVESFIEKGYLREAILNFIALLGWNPGTSRPPAADSGTGQRPEKEKEIYSLSELIEAFSIERVHKGGAVFDTTKLDWLQGQWMRKFSSTDFADRIRAIVGEKFPEAMSDPKFEEKAKLIQERIMFFSEAPEMMSFFYEEPMVTIELLASKKQKVDEADLPKILELLLNSLSSIPEKDWSQESIMNVLEPVIATSGFKKGQILWPMRAALTGREYSPGAYEVAAMLGKEKTITRLKNVLQSC